MRREEWLPLQDLYNLEEHGYAKICMLKIFAELLTFRLRATVMQKQHNLLTAPVCRQRQAQCDEYKQLKTLW